jgi:hypothetical protein
MPKGRLLRALDTKRTTRAAVTTVNGGTTTVTLDHGTLTGLGDDDHTQYFNTTRGDARYVPLGRTITTSATSGLTGGGALSGNLSLSLAAGVAGNGLTLTDGVLAVGAGTLMTVGNDTVGLSNGSARYQVPVTGATPFTPTYTGLSTFAGSGLSFTAGGQFAVSAGTLISVGTSVGLSNGSAQYQVPVTGATTFTPAYTGLGTFAGNGLSFTGGQFAIGAGTLMTVGSTTVGLSNGSAQYQVPVTGATTFTPAYTALSTFAGNGLSFTGGEFVVGQGAGLTVSGTTVALTQPGTLTHNSSNTASGSHTHAITSSDDVNSSTTSLLKATNGALTLHRLTSNLITGLTTIATPLITTPTSEVGITMTTSGTHDIRITPQKDLDLAPTQNLILEPGGDVILDPTGNDVYPQNNYDLNLGLINKKFLTLHAAELWVETLVAQNTIATIGGRILVGPTTTLIADLTTTATTIDVKHNEMTAGDIVYMEDAGKVEFMAIVSYNQAITGGHRYTVTRRVDSSPSNAWVAGDAVFNTGQKDDGFIDLYSIQSIKRRSDQTNNETGPTIVGNVRTAHTTPATDFNKWSPRWAIGNLNGLYGYSGNVYGFAAGKYENTAAPGSTNNTWLSADENNGIRIRNGSYDRFQVTTDGSVRLSDNGGNLRLFLNANGGAFGLYDGVNVGARPQHGGQRCDCARFRRGWQHGACGAGQQRDCARFQRQRHVHRCGDGHERVVYRVDYLDKRHDRRVEHRQHAQRNQSGTDAGRGKHGPHFGRNRVYRRRDQLGKRQRGCGILGRRRA